MLTKYIYIEHNIVIISLVPRPSCSHANTSLRTVTSHHTKKQEDLVNLVM